MPWQSRLQVDGLVLPIGAMVGIVEDRKLLSKPTQKRTLNGTASPLLPIYAQGPKPKRLYGVTFSASGDAVRWTPNFCDLPLDRPFWADCTKHMAAAIPAGQTSVTLPRPIVPGSRVKVFRQFDREERPPAAKANDAWTPLDVSVDPTGLIVSVSAPCDVNLSVQFLPRMQLVLADYGDAAPEIEGKASWTLACEEYQPL